MKGSPYVRVLPASPEEGIEISVEPQLSALSDRYAARGLLKSVLDTAAEQIKKEEETRAMAPDAYRLSLLSDAAISGCYRQGKPQMETADLIRYFSEMRSLWIKDRDFSEDNGIDLCEGGLEMPKEAPEAPKTRALTAATVRLLPQRAAGAVKASFSAWFNGSRADSSRETRRFPFSAFAAVIAVAMSLMLIVVGSVLLNSAERSVGLLKSQVSELSGEVAEMRADMEAHSDLLEIRRIAVEEYGMVDEEYLKMQYLVLESEDKVEVYEEEREETIGLSAILSAFGIKSSD